MATVNKTVSWAFATRITTLATNTTLATATRHDWAAITIDMPELTRTIRSARFRVTCRDVASSAFVFLGWRMGVKLGAVAFDDVDYATLNISFTGHETLIVERDVTAYFITNFGGGASQTCQVGVAFSQVVASTVNNLTAELQITYDYDNTAATHVKTVEIPIQGHYAALSTSDTEIGCTGGVSDAPVNQIPNLSTFCPEAGKTFKQVYLRVTAHDFSNGSTDTQLSLKLDSGGTYDVRALNKQAIGPGAQYRDIVDLTAAPYSITTNAVHALIAKSNIATTTFQNLSAVLVVTYTFTVASTTRELHSCRAVVGNDRAALGITFGSLAADTNQYAVQLEVQEPGTITLLQSGVVVFDQNQLALNALVNANGQGARAITIAGFPSFGVFTCPGTRVYTRRCDHDSSTWALARGTNRLALNVRASVTSAPGLDFSGFAIINYTADIPARGIGGGNRSCAYSLVSHTTPTDFVSYVTAAERIPSFPSSPWMVSSAWCDLGIRTYGVFAAMYSLQSERQTGEDIGDGWYQDEFPVSGGNLGGAFANWSRRETMRPIAPWIKRSSYGRTAMDVTVSRRWRLCIATGTSSSWTAAQWLTLHDISFTVAGTVTVGGATVADGGTVKIYADNGVDTEYITSATIAGGAGAFTLQVTDNTRTYFGTYSVGGNQGWSGPGTPGSSTFNINISTTTSFTTSDRTLLTGLSTNYTPTRAGYLDYLDAATSSRAAAATALSTVQWTNARAVLQDYLDVASSTRAPASTALSTVQWTNARAVLQDYLDVASSTRASAAALATVQADTDDLQARLPAALDGSGNIKAAVQSLVANAITAAVVATNAIDADALAADAVTELQVGLASAAAQALIQADTTTLTGRLTGTRATALDNLDATTSSRATAAAVTAAQADLTTLTARLTSIRAGLLDNLDAAMSSRLSASAGALLATAAAVAGLPTATQIRDALLAYALRSGRTVKGHLRRVDALLFGKATGLVGALATLYQPGGSTAEFTATQDTVAGTRAEVDTTTSET